MPEGAYFINCTTHFRARPHHHVLQDGGLVCAPQFALGLTGMSAYYLTHVWIQDGLSAVAHELFRVRMDVEPKLAFTPQLGLMILANLSLVQTHLPASIAARYQDDLSRRYTLYRRLPLVLAMTVNRRMIHEKAERCNVRL